MVSMVSAQKIWLTMLPSPVLNLDFAPAIFIQELEEGPSVPNIQASGSTSWDLPLFIPCPKNPPWLRPL